METEVGGYLSALPFVAAEDCSAVSANGRNASFGQLVTPASGVDELRLA